MARLSIMRLIDKNRGLYPAGRKSLFGKKIKTRRHPKNPFFIFALLALVVLCFLLLLLLLTIL